jgi:hypothetical protein
MRQTPFPSASAGSEGMCNLYSITRSREAMLRLFRRKVTDPAEVAPQLECCLSSE